MAWGNGTDKVIDDWIKKIESDDPGFTSLSILSFRKPTQEQFVKLFKALKDNTNLTEFYCSGKSVGLDAIEALADSLRSNSTLKTLSIGYATFGDDGPAFTKYLEGLSQFKGSLSVDLSGFGISPIHKNSLAAFFKQNTGVSSINLSSNSLESASLVVVGQAIKENRRRQTPITLEISDNSFETLEGFFEYLPADDFLLGELNSYDNTIAESEIGQLLSLAKKSPVLKTLRLSCPTGKEKKLEVAPFEEDYVQFDRTPHPSGVLETLLVSGVSVLSLNLSQGAGFLSLKSLTIRNAGMGDGYFTQTLAELLGSAPSLEHLDLGANHLSDSTLWTSLSSSTRLKKICLLGNLVSLECPALQQAHSGWDHLLQLDLNCNKLTLAGFSRLAAMLITGIDGTHIASALTVLEVSGHCSETDQDEWLAQANALQTARPSLKVYYK